VKKLFLLVTASLLLLQIVSAQHKPRKKNKMSKQNVMKSMDYSKCLPPGITIETVVSTKDLGFDKGKMLRKVATIYVKETLEKLGGKCVSGKLVDKAGKEIKFYNLQGCWGNPPADYLEILETQTKEIADLKKKFTVIELTCNPSGGMIP
jgi:hypothetical protein